MILSLFISRVILKNLGVVDYGIYGVVGSVVTLVSFFNIALVTAAQRCLAVELGNQEGNYWKVFNAIFTYCIVVAFTVYFILFFLGVNIISQLNIPSVRINAAETVFNYSCFSFLLSTLHIPFTSSLIAKEKIGVYSLINIIDIVLRFASACLLIFCEGDLLVAYSVLIVLVNLFVLILYIFISPPVKLQLNFDKTYLRKVGKYFGWNLLGGISSVGLLQGLQILLNMFFNPIVNAAQTLTVQVKAAIETFASNIRTATTPQIIKNCASGNFDETLSILSLSIKLSTIVILIICIPVYIKIDEILKLWLGNTPEYTNLFIRLMLINCIIDVVSSPTVAVIQTAGNIKAYQVCISIILLSVLPVSYIFFYLGLEPYFYAVAIIGSSIITFGIRLFFLKKIIPLPLNSLYMKMIVQAFILPILIFIPSYYISTILAEGFFNMVAVATMSFFLTLVFGFYLLLSHEERKKLLIIVKRKITK